MRRAREGGAKVLARPSHAAEVFFNSGWRAGGGGPRQGVGMGGRRRAIKAGERAGSGGWASRAGAGKPSIEKAFWPSGAGGGVQFGGQAKEERACPGAQRAGPAWGPGVERASHVGPGHRHRLGLGASHEGEGARGQARAPFAMRVSAQFKRGDGAGAAAVGQREPPALEAGAGPLPLSGRGKAPKVKSGARQGVGRPLSQGSWRAVGWQWRCGGRVHGGPVKIERASRTPPHFGCRGRSQGRRGNGTKPARADRP